MRSQRLKFGSSFYVFALAAEPALCKLGEPGGLFLHLRFSLWSSDLPLFYFHRLFPFFVFEPQLDWTPFSCSNYLTIPFKCFFLCPAVCVSCSVVSDSLKPMDCRLPGFSVHGIPQTRILEWVVISFSRESS